LISLSGIAMIILKRRTEEFFPLPAPIKNSF
jgi:hypothetical protein